jgi:hypothetical protein
MIMRHALLPLAVLLFAMVASIPSLAFSEITSFTDRASWEAAAGGAPSVFDDFNDITQEVVITWNAPVDRGPYTLSSSPTGYSYLEGPSSYDPNYDLQSPPTPYFKAQLDDSPSTEVRFTFDTPVTSWGADVNPHPNGVGDVVQAVLDSVPHANAYTLPGSDVTAFRGIVSTTPFTTLTLRAQYASAFHGVDNIGAHPIPEPSTFVLTILGLLGLAWYSRRRRGR